VLEDSQYTDVITISGQTQAITVQLPRFTVIGATTRPDQLDKPLRDRFVNHVYLQEHSVDTLAKIAINTATQLGVLITHQAAEALAARARGTPRMVIGLVKQARDYAQVGNDNLINVAVAQNALSDAGIDEWGMTSLDRRVLRVLVDRGTPMGIAALAAAARESKAAIEEMVEPYLLALGLMDRTPKGRVATEKAYTVPL
jgi:holliday junction DNA helicase RuvB